ncbi:MAG: 3-phosphoshikimate 1-carboxyvinyltransferase [Lachnospiraceae bacterium]|nr:3-phosphoshikimate 1-carboxyvinyltransferase [Lachnospiraceae bacterium]
MIRPEVPGSKSITNRALLLAAMAEGESLIRGCLSSEDAKVFLEALETLGFEIVKTPSAGSRLVKNEDVKILGRGGEIPVKAAEVYVGSAGTAARFLVAMLAFSDGSYTVRSSEQMKKRPMAPLIEALKAAGAEVECLEEEGHFPLRITGCGGRTREEIRVRIDQSSQFLSALLIAAAASRRKTRIIREGDHGLAYVDMTIRMLSSFGVKAECAGACYAFDGSASLKGREYRVEPDVSAAAYFYAMAAILGKEVAVSGVHEGMLQGDTEFIRLLEKTGCELREEEATLILRGPEGGKLRGGFTADMSRCSDQALTLAAIAPFADAPIRIAGVSHIRFQECDRIAAICKNLSALGIECREEEDGVTIVPGTPHAAELESFGDHRVAMSFGLTALRCPGTQIRDRECCRKTFAEYFDVLDSVL